MKFHARFDSQGRSISACGTVTSEITITFTVRPRASSDLYGSGKAGAMRPGLTASFILFFLFCPYIDES